MTSIDYNNVNIKIKRLIQYFDNMSWNIFNIVYEDLEKYDGKANIDRENRSMCITCNDVEITYYSTDDSFTIEVYVSKKHFSDNKPIILTHKIYDNGDHTLDIFDESSSNNYKSVSIDKFSFINSTDLEKVEEFIKKVNSYFSQWYINNTKEPDVLFAKKKAM